MNRPLTYRQRRRVSARLRAIGRYHKALKHPLSASQRARAASRLRGHVLALWGALE